MTNSKPGQNAKQQLYREMVLGTLLYSVVLGFFNDYTDILHTGSYSVTFAVAVVMQVLTYLTFLLKGQIAGWFKKREGKRYKVGLVVGVWLVLFLSKFVFLAVIDYLFSDVEISGFIGLLIIIVCLTLMGNLVLFIDKKLAD